MRSDKQPNFVLSEERSKSPYPTEFDQEPSEISLDFMKTAQTLKIVLPRAVFKSD